MLHQPRIYVSVAAKANLDRRQVSLRKGISDAIEAEGLEPQIFLEAGIPKSMSWSFDNVNKIMQRCWGAVVLAFFRLPPSGLPSRPGYTSEYNHYEGAVAIAQGLPTFIATEEGARSFGKGVLWQGGGRPILYIPQTATTSWLRTPEFTLPFKSWVESVKTRQEVFFGYSSAAKSTADAIMTYLTNSLNVSVLEYATGFRGGATILDEIERAAQSCMCGIFLFTKDDPLVGQGDQASPRDNVIFEAGYFMRARGQERVLIIREEGAKMPADIGGNIYLSLQDRSNTKTIETALRNFLVTSL